MNAEAFVQRLLVVAEERKVADIFLSESGVHLKIRGALVRLEHASSLDLKAVVHLLTGRELSDARDGWAPKEIDASFIESDLIDKNSPVAGFRVNVFRSMGTTCAVLRVIEREVKGLASLEVAVEVQKSLEELCKQRGGGLILVAGGTGSGKSSTLRAMVQYINNTRETHILWIEDPQEVVLMGRRSLITQRQLKSDTRNWISALKSALRQSADVVVLGEIRGHAVMERALEAAQTGHLVLATYHGGDVADVLRRILGAAAPDDVQRLRNQLVHSLRAIIVQQLLLREDGGDGRVPAMEVLRMNEDVRRAIIEDKLHELSAIMERNTSGGMQTMDRALRMLATRRKIGWETVRSRSRPER